MGVQYSGKRERKLTVTKRKFQFLLTDLVDHLSIDQIKEVLLPENRRRAYAEEMQWLADDIDRAIEKRQIKPTGRLVRLIVFLAQANLHTWYHKDRLDSEPGQYYDLLNFAQELNGLRNLIRNHLMEEFEEMESHNRKATFLGQDGNKWYSSIINGMKRPSEV